MRAQTAAGGVAGSGEVAGAGIVAVRPSVTVPVGGGVTTAIAVVTTPAGSSLWLTFDASTTSRREIFQIAALEATRKSATTAVPQSPRSVTDSARAPTR